MATTTQKNNAEPSTPASGSTVIYVDSSSKKISSKDDTGTVTEYGASTDSKQVKISSADTTEGYLEDKVTAGANITINKIGTGSNESLEIVAASGAVDPLSELAYFDDFITPGGQSAMGPFCFQPGISGTGASTNSSPQTIPSRPGIIRLQAGTASQSSYSGIYTGVTTNSTNATLLFSTSVVHQYMFMQYINNVDHADGLFYVWGGFLDTINTSNARNGAYVYFDSSLSLNWQFVTADRGTRTTTDTGVAATIGWAKFDITVEDVASTLTATLKIDDVLCATNTTNIPTTSGEGTGIAHRIRKFDAVATLRYLDMDWVDLTITTGTRV